MKQSINNEFLRMQKLAGLITENFVSTIKLDISAKKVLQTLQKDPDKNVSGLAEEILNSFTFGNILSNKLLNISDIINKMGEENQGKQYIGDFNKKIFIPKFIELNGGSEIKVTKI